MKRLLSILLALTMLLSLAACGGGNDAAREAELSFASSAFYRAEDVPLPVAEGTLLGCCPVGTDLCVLARDRDEQLRLWRTDPDTGESTELTAYAPVEQAVSVYGPLAAGGGLWVVERWTDVTYDLPEDFDESRDDRTDYISSLTPHCLARKLDASTGRELRQADVSQTVQAEGGQGFYWAADGEDRLYLAVPDAVTVLDKKGQPLFTLEGRLAWTGTGSPLALLPDGRVAALLELADGREVRPIDPEARDWDGERYPAAGKDSLLLPGTGPFLYFYEGDGLLCGQAEGEDAPQQVLDWSGASIDSSALAELTLLEGDRAALLTAVRGGNGLDAIRLSVLTPSDLLEDGRTVLVYGTIGADNDLRYRINQFNSGSEDYYIVVRDYALEPIDYFDAAVYQAQRKAAVDRANKEITAGRIPDILDDTLPLEIYSGRGVLEDLWPWIEGDPDLGREALMDHVLDCASVDGKLYQVTDSFRIETAAVSAALADGRRGWTLKELLAAYETLPQGASIRGDDLSGLFLLQTLTDQSLDVFVNWTEGTCSFDGEDFRALLALCLASDTGDGAGNPFFASEAGQPLRDGRQLMTEASLSSPGDLLYYDALFGGPEALTPVDYDSLLAGRRAASTNLADVAYLREHGTVFGGQLAGDAVCGVLEGGPYAAFLGCPTGDGGSGGAFLLSQTVAMSAACKAKEGAWAYIRQELLPGGRRDSAEDRAYTGLQGPGFPINRADMEALWRFQPMLDLEGQEIPGPDGQPLSELVNYYTIGRDPIPMVLYTLSPTQAQYRRFMDLYQSVRRVKQSDSTISAIITEAATPYFAEEATLDETVSQIQSRVTLYLGEQG